MEFNMRFKIQFNPTKDDLEWARLAARERGCDIHTVLKERVRAHILRAAQNITIPPNPTIVG